MSFELDPEGFYRPAAFNDFPWLFAGFGTRKAPRPDIELATVHQIHSATVVKVDAPGAAGAGDALIALQEGLFLAIKTADCIPLLIADVRLRATAAVHAGWRGTAQRIGPAAIQAMQDAYGSKAEDLQVAIGPGIGPCCYEVGPEVARAFPGHGEGPAQLNLAAVNRQQLEACGVPSGQIHEAGLCTYCRAKDFFSFRREREKAGRMLSIIGTHQ